MSTPAMATDAFAPGPTAPIGDNVDLSVRVGGGIKVQPEFEGSDEYQVVPWPIVSLEILRLPGLGEFGGPSTGFSFSPSFNVVGERDPKAGDDLFGLDKVDTTIELGGKVGFTTDTFGGFVAVRRGFGGHEGVVGEAGLDIIMRPTDRLTFIGGPRVTAASDKFFDSYYSVSPAESAATGLPTFDASGGFKSVGVAGELVYNLTELMDLHLEAGWDHLVGDAAKSPIVADAGSKNTFTVGAGVSYRLDLDLFK